MLDIVRRYGVHLVNLIHLLHIDVTLRWAKVETEIRSGVGAKQGDTLAPILFLCHLGSSGDARAGLQ
jgi:hypothetical protein